MTVVKGTAAPGRASNRAGYRPGMTTAPFEPDPTIDPELVPGSDPETSPDPVAPGETGTPDAPEPQPTES